MVSDVWVGQDMLWCRRARSAFRESANGNGIVKQIENSSLGAPAVVLTVGTTIVEDMWAAGHGARTDLGVVLVADLDEARIGSTTFTNTKTNINIKIKINSTNITNSISISIRSSSSSSNNSSSSSSSSRRPHHLP
jgi:hypothetical protein